jgi:hypothetical protein
MLTKMMEEAGTLSQFSLPDQRIYQKLAASFQESFETLFMNPEELQQTFQMGTKEQWRTLLNFQETQSFIKAQMAFLGQISQRKTFHSLVQMAISGNAQAAKQVQELSGILNQQDANRTIVLHHIPRPNKEEFK